MARWPSVPAMFGWLRLDRRGRWLLIDRGAPGFDEALHGLGSAITSPSIVDFIARNYEFDGAGRWYWQNGPQRVYVDIELAPLILRVFVGQQGQTLVTHCGDPANQISALASSADGDLWVRTEHGPGVVHDLDLAQLELELDGASDLARSLRWNGATLPIEQLIATVSMPIWANFVAQPRSLSEDS